MKRLIFTAMALIMALPLWGCAPHEQGGGEGLSIVATIFPPYDFAREVAGEGAEVTLLLPPGADYHSFEPTPRDIIAIEECDLFIYTGGRSESWAEELLSSMDNGPRAVISMLEVADPLREELAEGMQAHGHGEGHGHEDSSNYDEHVWTSPVNARKIVDAIADELSLLDGANANAYRDGAAAYCLELDRLDGEFRALTGSAERNTLVFGDRFPMRYFTEEYGLDYYAAFPGCSEDTEASAATLAFLIDKVKAEGIPVVFSIELSDGKVAQAISEATGAKVLSLTSCHNLTREELEAGLSYVEMMEGNLKSLEEALN